MKRSALLVTLGLVAVAGALVASRVVSSRRAADAAPPAPVLHVPRATGEIKIDAETEEPAWTKPPGPARTGELLADGGKPARPHTEARLLWTDDDLYIAVLASDEDIRSSDFLHVVLNADGVVDNPSGFDEEWNVEMAVPFASLGAKGARGATLGLTLHRCDTPKTSGAEVCASYRATLVLD